MQKIMVLVIAGILLIPVSDADAYDIAFAVPYDVPNVVGDSIDVLSKRIGESVGDTVTLEIVPEREMLMGRLQAGEVQMAGVPPEWLAEFNPNITTFALPFVFEDASAVEAFAWSPEAADILESLQEYDIRGFSYWPSARRVILSADRIDSIAALEGRNMRVHNALTLGAYQSLGVNAMPVAAAETYMALQTGTIDAAETTLDYAIQQNLDEWVPFAVLGGYTSSGLVIVANAAFWGELSEDAQEAYLTAISVATNTLYAALKADAGDDAGALAEAGFTVVPPSQQFTLAAIEEGASVWSGLGIDPGVIEVAQARTRGGGDYCSIGSCKCINRECSEDCCPDR